MDKLAYLKGSLMMKQALSMEDIKKSYEDNKGAYQGAGGGAVMGGVAAAMTGDSKVSDHKNKLMRILLGMIAGGVTGGFIGSNRDQGASNKATGARNEATGARNAKDISANTELANNLRGSLVNRAAGESDKTNNIKPIGNDYGLGIDVDVTGKL